jgi:hypothetical protein
VGGALLLGSWEKFAMKSFLMRGGRRSAKVRDSARNTIHALERRLLFAAFTPGDVVVYQTGTGSTALSNATTNPVVLDEYSPTGTLVQAITLPSTSAGSGTNVNQPLTDFPNGVFGAGLLTLSSDGSTLVVPGYDGSSTSLHTVGLVGVNGVPNTSNTFTDFGARPDGVASPDGSTLYLATTSNDLVIATAGGNQGETGTVASSTLTDIRGVEIVNGVVYVSDQNTAPISADRLASLSGNTLTNLPGTAIPNLSSPYGFFFASDTSIDDTLYVADNGTGSVDKFSLVGGVWDAEGSFPALGVVGLTGVQTSPTSVTIYGTEDPFGTSTASALYVGTDTLSPSGPTMASGTALSSLITMASSSTSNVQFRGVALVPQSPSLPSITTQPTPQSAVVGTTATFSAWAAGTPAPTVQWMVNRNDGSGFVPDTTDVNTTFTTLTVPSVTTVENGYQYEAVFKNGSGTKTSNPAALSIINAPQLTFDASSYTVNEGTSGTSVSVKVDRIGNTSASNTVTITAINGSAIAGTNYTTAITGTNYSGGILTFPAGDTSETISVPILSQHPQGGNKSFTLTLSNPTGSGATLNGILTTTITITDNLETFTLNAPSYTVDETAGVVEIGVDRTGLLDPAVISYSTVAGSAIDGANYTGTGGATSGTVTFASGQQVADISLPIMDVTPQGGNLNFTVNLSIAGAGTNLGTDFGALGSTPSAPVTIVDAAPLTNNLSGDVGSIDNLEVLPSGDGFNSGFTLIVGDNSTTNPTQTELSFDEYSVFTFSQALSPSVYPSTGFTVNSLSNLSLTMYSPPDAAYHPLQSGNFNLYYIPDSVTTTPTANLSFNPAFPTGIDPSQFQAAPQLLGTFSYQGGLSTGTFVTYTPASLTGVSSEIIGDLNTGLTFRLAGTPTDTGIGAIATRIEGLFVQNSVDVSPSLGITANVVQTAQAETLALTSPTYSVNETGGTANITLSRTGATNDTAQVTYTLTDGTALEGTNYGTAGTSSPSITGTATFTPGSGTTSFNVPIINVANEDGDKALTITLSNPTSNSTPGPTTLAVLGQSTAVLTIKDSSTAPTETLENYAARVADIESSGVFSTAFRIDGGSFASSYGVADFNDASVLGPNGPDSYAPANPITAINSITLNIFYTGGGTSGPVDVYLVPDAASSIADTTNPSNTLHTFDINALPEGLDTSGSNSFGTPILLGKINWVANVPGQTDTLLSLPLLNYTTATANTLISDLNNNDIFRIVATPENGSVDASWGSFAGSFQGNSEAPQVAIGVQEGVVSALPAWLAAGSNATWTSATKSLVVHGAADIIADPGTDEPIITTDGGAASILKVDVASGGTLQAIHIGGITLAGGASMIVDSVGSGRTATNHDELLIASGGAFSIDSLSKLDLVDNDADFVGGSLSAITNSLRGGFNGNGGWWTGGGIVSSKAAASPASKTLGVKMISGGVLVKYTYVGDADLSGTITAADYVAIDNGFNMSSSGYANGDFNYDGKINGDDYAMIDNSYNTQAAISGASPLAVVAGSSEQIAVAKPAPTSVFATGVPITASAALPFLTGTAPAGTDSLFADDKKKTLVEDVLG